MNEIVKVVKTNSPSDTLFIFIFRFKSETSFLKFLPMLCIVATKIVYCDSEPQISLFYETVLYRGDLVYVQSACILEYLLAVGFPSTQFAYDLIVPKSIKPATLNPAFIRVAFEAP